MKFSRAHWLIKVIQPRFLTCLAPGLNLVRRQSRQWYALAPYAYNGTDGARCLYYGRPEGAAGPPSDISCTRLRGLACQHCALCGVAPLYIRVLPLGCGYIAMYTSRRRTNSPTSVRIVATRGRIPLVLSRTCQCMLVRLSQVLYLAMPMHDTSPRTHLKMHHTRLSLANLDITNVEPATTNLQSARMSI